MSKVATTIDCGGLTALDVAARLNGVRDVARVDLTGGDASISGLLSGRCEVEKVKIGFPLGEFAFMLADVESIEVDGDVGSGCGHSMVSGTVLVRGSVGDFLGVHAAGGMLAALGTAGNYCGQYLCGADLFVRSRVGKFAGACMSSGTLVLGNGAGEQLGVGMTGGVIYARGDIKSVSDSVKMHRMKDADFMRLSLLLARAGIKSDGKDFKAFRTNVNQG